MFSRSVRVCLLVLTRWLWWYYLTRARRRVGLDAPLTLTTFGVFVGGSSFFPLLPRGVFRVFSQHGVGPRLSSFFSDDAFLISQQSGTFAVYTSPTH